MEKGPRSTLFEKARAQPGVSENDVCGVRTMLGVLQPPSGLCDVETDSKVSEGGRDRSGKVAALSQIPADSAVAAKLQTRNSLANGATADKMPTTPQIECGFIEGKMAHHRATQLSGRRLYNLGISVDDGCGQKK